ncbi:MAG: aminopeptidase N [Pseudomonadota bacterium]
MRTDTGQMFHLSDYAPFDFEVLSVSLHVKLDPEKTVVGNEMHLRRAAHAPVDAPLVLDGDDLTFLEGKLNGVLFTDDQLELHEEGLTLKNLPEQGDFVVTVYTEINPTTNTQLMGLYRSCGNYCTQCEAEGFRRITFYPDRPDVMSVFTTRIEADKATNPVLLGNGNLEDSGELKDGHHFAVWHDPHPKPAYLFALVAGDLGHITDRFTTMSGRDVELRIYVEHGKENQADYAMDALKRSMAWDEEVWGREYDLDIFQIVAVSDFNMGAMENKGLNIFNDRLVLASPDTATDANYAAIEAVIAHEYFHNWTGNRITCRDWFQLCLKEGLTVYRDSEFSADMRSAAVKRIEDVILLRAAQFPEDAGPLAHPVRPDSYREINNFYTATVYEKGSEVVRMLRTFIGEEPFWKGVDLYFRRHDGEATTIEAWLACFSETSGRNLDQFALWYSQAGTPTVEVREHWDAAAYTITLAQQLPATPDKRTKRAMTIPLAYGLLDPDGHELETGQIELDAMSQTVTFEAGHGLTDKPTLSMGRGFSAPVKFDFPQSLEDRLHLAAHDTDSFNRWQALQDVAITAQKQAVIDGSSAAEIITAKAGLGDAIGSIITDSSLDAAFRALCLKLPDAGRLAQEIGQDVDSDQLHSICKSQADALAIQLEPALVSQYEAAMPAGAYDPGADGAGGRQLANMCLDLLVRTGKPEYAERAKRQFETTDNMTNRLAAMSALAHHENGTLSEAALSEFEATYKHEPLVMDLWLGLQARLTGADALDRVARLTDHSAFSWETPNRVYALVRTFAMANLTGFNKADGSGYTFVAESVARLNTSNPQVAARLLTAFRSIRTLEPGRRKLAETALERLLATPNLSRDVADILSRTLAN